MEKLILHINTMGALTWSPICLLLKKSDIFTSIFPVLIRMFLGFRSLWTALDLEYLAIYIIWVGVQITLFSYYFSLCFVIKVSFIIPLFKEIFFIDSIIDYLKGEGLHTAMLGVWNLGPRIKLGVCFKMWRNF